VLVVGGTVAEWESLSPAAWDERVAVLGEVAGRHGIAWVTVRPHRNGTPVEGEVRAVPVGAATVLVDPTADGRGRFAAAMRRLGDEAVNEASVAAALYEPADSEPDLVVVLGPSDRLPPSLVWELAYAELVFVPTGWADLGAADLEAGIAEFGRRRRRFGGVEP
jgi:undecaprenyl diphosphate synthase